MKIWVDADACPKPIKALVFRASDRLSIPVVLVANGFLQNMVRNIVGVLTAIGSQEEPVIWARQVLESKDRTKGGVTALPHGLYFLGPTYDDHFGLPKTVRIPQIAKDILRSDPLQ